MTDLTHPRGDTLNIEVNTTDVPSGTPAVFTLKKSLKDVDGSALLQGSNIINNNQTIITFTDDLLVTLPAPGLYYWDVQVTIGVETYTLDSGKFYLSQDVKIAP